MRISRLQAAQCSIPLPRPIKLGPVEIRSRDFVVLRLTTDSGLVGDAIGYPRGTALLEEVRAAASFFLGVDPHARKQAMDHAAGRLINNGATMSRAFSLFDIALADIAAKSVGLPLHRMMGAVRDRIPVMAVAGYYLAERSIEDVANEVAALADNGYARVKVMLDGSDPNFDLRYVSAIRERTGVSLGVDAHWSWRTFAEADRTCRMLDGLGLAFIEDPFGPQANGLLGRLGAGLRTPLAAGEDMPGPEVLAALVPSVGFLRVDATTVGGIDSAIAVSEAAGLAGCTVLPHVFSPIHAQLAGCCSAVEMVEFIPESTRADPMGLLLRRLPRIEDGILQIDQEPGAGFDLDWPAVAKNAVSVVELEPAA